MRDLEAKRLNDEKQYNQITTKDTHLKTKIRGQKCTKLDTEITLAQLVHLVQKELKTTPQYAEHPKSSSLNVILTLLMIIVTCMTIGITVYPKLKDSPLNIFRKEESDIENCDTIRDVSIFSNITYFGSTRRLDFLVAKIEAMFNAFDTEPERMLNMDYKVTDKNILLWGPPGTGKTLFVKVFSYLLETSLKIQKSTEKEITIQKLKEMPPMVTLLCARQSALVSKFVGESEKNLEKLFKDALNIAKDRVVIVFIDEIDSLMKQRGSLAAEHSTNTLNTFLNILDGISTSLNTKMLVVGATNVPDSMDSAAKRRFGNQVFIGNPSAAQRGHLIQSLAGEYVIFDSASEIQTLVNLTNNMSIDTITKVFRRIRQAGKTKTAWTVQEVCNEFEDAKRNMMDDNYSQNYSNRNADDDLLDETPLTHPPAYYGHHLELPHL